MRRSEAIWIEKLNRWRINIQKDGKRVSFYSTKPSKAGKIEAERLADKWLESGQIGDARFEELWKTFLKRAQQTTGTANYQKHQTIGKNWLLPHLEHKKLSKLNPMMFQECIDAAYIAGRSKRTCVNIRSSITALARHAQMLNLPFINVNLLTIPKNAPTGKRRILQPENIKLLFRETMYFKENIIQPAFYIYAWRFLVITGLRRGEMCGLRKEDITGNIVDIKRSINRFNEITTGKNDNARRCFELPDSAMSILNDQEKQLKSLGIISPWIFPGMDGDKSNPKQIYDDWKRYCAYHNFDCSIHELRHTMISHVKSDVPEALLKQLIGHSAAMDTHGVYGHNVEGELHRTASLIDSVFSKIIK